MFTDNSESLDSTLKSKIEEYLEIRKELDERDKKRYEEFMKGFYDILYKTLENNKKEN